MLTMPSIVAWLALFLLFLGLYLPQFYVGKIRNRLQQKLFAKIKDSGYQPAYSFKVNPTLFSFELLLIEPERLIFISARSPDRVITMQDITAMTAHNQVAKDALTSSLLPSHFEVSLKDGSMVQFQLDLSKSPEEMNQLLTKGGILSPLALQTLGVGVAGASMMMYRTVETEEATWTQFREIIESLVGNRITVSIQKKRKASVGLLILGIVAVMIIEILAFVAVFVSLLTGDSLFQ
jgi:hypothetical protein